jgi:hypothetical protein
MAAQVEAYFTYLLERRLNTPEFLRKISGYGAKGTNPGEGERDD